MSRTAVALVPPAPVILPLSSCAPRCLEKPEERSFWRPLWESVILVLVAVVLLCVPPATRDASNAAAQREMPENGVVSQYTLQDLGDGVRTLRLHSGKQLWIIDDALPAEFTKRWRRYLLTPADQDGKEFVLDGNSDFASGIDTSENVKVDHYPDDVHPLTEELIELSIDKAREVSGLGLTDSHSVARIYTNYINRDSQGLIHVDEALPGHFTLLWFCHDYWHANYGGEFTLYDMDAKYTDDGNAYLDRMLETQGTKEELEQFERDLGGTDVHAILPRPNRLVFFPSDILHSARPPQVDIEGFRLSTAIKILTNDVYEEREAN